MGASSKFHSKLDKTRVTVGPFVKWKTCVLPQTFIPENRPSLKPLNRAQTKYLLVRLGYKDYADYLQSDLWKSIRARVLRNHPKCRAGCGGNRATQVHHRVYREANLLGTDLKHLVAICAACHQAIEFEGDKKLNVHQANAKLAARKGRKKRKR